MIINICCNNTDNGLFEGRAHFITIAGRDIEFSYKNEKGAAFVELPENRFRISGAIFKYVSGKEWVGNWCWNAYWLPKSEGERFEKYLRYTGRWEIAE